MRFFSIILILLLTVSAYSQEKKYVSTWGMKLEIVPEVDKSNTTTLYEISSDKQKKLLLNSLYNFVEKESDGGKMMFNVFAMQFNNFNYEKKKIYVLISELTNENQIDQPYLENGKLFFHIEKKEKQENHYVYLRVYKVDIDKDLYEKYIYQDNNELKLIPVKL